MSLITHSLFNLTGESLMAKKLISPGVLTNEIDASFLPAALGDIGAAIIGPTVKGPVLVPTIIQNKRELEEYKRENNDLRDQLRIKEAIIAKELFEKRELENSCKDYKEKLNFQDGKAD